MLTTSTPRPPGTYHYVSHVLGLPALLSGVDVNPHLMARANANAQDLGLGPGVRFTAAPIADFKWVYKGGTGCMSKGTGKGGRPRGIG